jgi:hypothetical protein
MPPVQRVDIVGAGDATVLQGADTVLTTRAGKVSDLAVTVPRATARPLRR